MGSEEEPLERVSSTESESEKDVCPRDTEFIIVVTNESKKIMFKYILKSGKILPYTRLMKGETCMYVIFSNGQAAKN